VAAKDKEFAELWAENVKQKAYIEELEAALGGRKTGGPPSQRQSQAQAPEEKIGQTNQNSSFFGSLFGSSRSGSKVQKVDTTLKPGVPLPQNGA